MSKKDQNRKFIGEMFSGANTSMPAPDRHGFTPGNVQQPAPTPSKPTVPKSEGKFNGSFTPTNITMPAASPKPPTKPGNKK